MTLAAIVAVAGAYVSQSGGTSGGLSLELWQVINLVGTPILAVLFVRPVIDDVKAWLTSGRN